MRVFILANSPGEFAGWVRPVVESIHAFEPGCEIIPVVVPCQFASGRELEYAQSLPGISRVVCLKELILKAHQWRSDHSCVLYLGGDAAYAVLAARLLKCPSAAYLSKPRWPKSFQSFLVTNEKSAASFLSHGVSPQKVNVVGQLALDSINLSNSPEAIKERMGIDAVDSRIVTLLPGSSPGEYRNAFPYLLQTAQEISRLCSRARVVIAVSPFADQEFIRCSISDFGANVEAEAGGSTVYRLPGGSFLSVEWENTHEVMSVSDVVLTPPGTVTLQLAAMGVPMIIIVPLQYVASYPVDGLLGALSDRSEFVCRIKKSILLKKAKQVNCLALPNIISGRSLVPEYVAEIFPEEIAGHIVALLNDREAREKMSGELRLSVGECGAASRIAKEVLRLANRGMAEGRNPEGGVCSHG